ncbi:universal stress protein [Luteibacter sp. SG786]|uniref:universal stress protein n=1 Tax=Luteibacter sp. SG786 TaxID=2587130 RepID=UPI0014243EA6|nr:universal stress protein [Luteibacter sp. SG786]NII54991.1 nucleotide-binding universal stress UspA family protein [Luteibacter sp. SG786]
MFKHILLPTDGTPASLRATRIAVELARRCGAHLTALHVVKHAPTRNHVGGVATVSETDSVVEAQQNAAACLAQVETMALARGMPCDATQVAHASPGRAILEFARQHACDLIVMGTHGRHGLERFVLGSKTEEVLLAARVPVLVCQDEPSLTFERILILVDGTEASDRAVHLCMDTAATLGSHVYALSVISPLPTVNLLADYIEGGGCFKRVTSSAQALLDDAKHAGDMVGVKVSTEYTFDHRPDTVAMARANAHRCDMIVVPGKGSGHRRSFLHDVARSILRNGEVPLLVCP